MAFNEELRKKADLAIRELTERDDLNEKKMFGGVAWMIGGNMAAGVLKESLIIRTGLENYDEAINQPDSEPFDFTGKVMRGFVVVPDALELNDKRFREWLSRGTSHAESLEPK